MLQAATLIFSTHQSLKLTIVGVKIYYSFTNEPSKSQL